MAAASAKHARRELLKRRRLGNLVVQCFLSLIDRMRQNARRHGYALAVHGTLLRDIDLIAVPWINRPKAASTLHKSLFRLVKVFHKDAYTANKPVIKPQGRVAWSINLGNGTYIDLSVVTPR